MLINPNLVKKDTVIGQSILLAKSEDSIAKTVSEMYHDNKKATLEVLHKENVLACFKYLVDKNYLFYNQTKDNL